MEELSNEKLEAALAHLEAERERRRDEQVAAGKLILLHTTRAVGVARETPEAIEAAKAAAIAKHLAQHPADRGKTFHVNVRTIITAVVRAEDLGDQNRSN
jgi:hypothetical protein